MIHTTIPDKHLPSCLKRKAVFGDREQIQALYDLEHIIIQNEERERLAAEGHLKQFRVSLEWSHTMTVKVWAKDRREAERIASDENEIDGCDFDDFSAWATEIKEDAKH